MLRRSVTSRLQPVAALEKMRARVEPGVTVAITAGSRGIHDKPAVVRTTGDWLRGLGADPFVVQAMGFRTVAATAEGQVGLLRALGMTEESLAMPIRASMDTVELSDLPDRPMGYVDRIAAGADGILVVNRIKAHTDFQAPPSRVDWPRSWRSAWENSAVPKECTVSSRGAWNPAGPRGSSRPANGMSPK